ncbi:MAG: DUF1761 domain-containing protein [Roseovarius sp.]|nr:DUF1761 domain-containing protein [Roseovarius sp.]
MEYLAVVVAAGAGFGVGAIWYALLSSQWMDAAGISKEAGDGNSGLLPFAVAFIAYLLVAGMMRHMFELSNIDDLAKGLVSGIGIGLFLISPWIMMNNSFAGRSFKLSIIDGGCATVGCAVTGAVLGFL